LYVLSFGENEVDYDFQNALERANGNRMLSGESKPLRMISEELGLKELNNFNQEMLRPDGVYLLDFESEAYIWVGVKVPLELHASVYEMALNAMQNSHCCG
jgi:hypothetical protein